jgi:hypothetical protein
VVSAKSPCKAFLGGTETVLSLATGDAPASGARSLACRSGRSSILPAGHPGRTGRHGAHAPAVARAPKNAKEIRGANELDDRREKRGRHESRGAHAVEVGHVQAGTKYLAYYLCLIWEIRERYTPRPVRMRMPGVPARSWMPDKGSASTYVHYACCQIGLDQFLVTVRARNLSTG